MSFIVTFQTAESAEVRFDSADVGVPARGDLVEWDFDSPHTASIPNGRYRVVEVVRKPRYPARVSVWLEPA